MGNKTNLITLRPNFNATVTRLNLDQALYAMSFLQHFDTLFLKKNVFLTDSKLLVIENKIFLTLFIFFRVAKLLKLLKKKQKKFKKYKKGKNKSEDTKVRKIITRNLILRSWTPLNKQKKRDKVNKFTTTFLFNKFILKKFRKSKSAPTSLNKTFSINNCAKGVKNNKFNKRIKNNTSTRFAAINNQFKLSLSKTQNQVALVTAVIKPAAINNQTKVSIDKIINKKAKIKLGTKAYVSKINNKTITKTAVKSTSNNYIKVNTYINKAVASTAKIKATATHNQSTTVFNKNLNKAADSNIALKCVPIIPKPAAKSTPIRAVQSKIKFKAALSSAASKLAPRKLKLKASVNGIAIKAVPSKIKIKAEASRAAIKPISIKTKVKAEVNSIATKAVPSKIKIKAAASSAAIKPASSKTKVKAAVNSIAVKAVQSKIKIKAAVSSAAIKPASSKTKIKTGVNSIAINPVSTKVKAALKDLVIKFTPFSWNVLNHYPLVKPALRQAAIKFKFSKIQNKVCSSLDKITKALIINKLNKKSLRILVVNAFNKQSNKIRNKSLNRLLINKRNKVVKFKKRKNAALLIKPNKATVLNKLKKIVTVIKLKPFSKLKKMRNTSYKVLARSKVNQILVTNQSNKAIVPKLNKATPPSKLNKVVVPIKSKKQGASNMSKSFKRGKKNQKKIKIKKKFASMFKAFSFFKVNLIVYTAINLNFCLKKHKNLISLFYTSLKKDALRLFPRRFRFFLDFVQISVLLLKQKIKAKFLLKNLVDIFRMLQKKLHSKFLNFISQYFKLLIAESSLLSVKLKGLKLVISGKLKGKPRSTKYIYSVGSVPIQTLSCNIDYAKGHAFTIYGVFGFKLWISI